MIILKSDEEVDEIRKAGAIVAKTLEKLRRHAKIGVQTSELDMIARDEILRLNGTPAFKNYKGFPGNICTSVNEVVVHGIPSAQRLKSGDIISIDVGAKFRHHYADTALTVGVGEISPVAIKLMQVTKEALDRGIEAARTGNRLSDISFAIQEFVETNGFSVVRAFVGHGIGEKIHEEPEIPNFGQPHRGPRLEAGMVLALEPMVNEGAFDVEVLDDSWTVVTKDRKLSAHFEHTIVITDDGAEVLTAL